MTPATITVNFISNYAGPHRICWRIQGSGSPYVCTNIVECTGGGNTCQAIISTLVDSETCVPIIFEGYIQATCNVEGSATDQVPFTVTYIPTPSCKPYVLTNNTGSTYSLLDSDLGVNCNGTVRPALPLINGASLYVCGIAGMPQLIIDLLDVVEEPTMCCTDCTSYSITSSNLFNANLFYIDCTTKELIRTVSPGDGEPALVICAVTDSVTSPSPMVVVDLGPC